MYRQGLVSISSNRQISEQILSEIFKNGKVISDVTSTQTLMFLINRPIGFLYIKIDNRTALRLASREMIIERINQLTGEVEYVLEIENAYRFGKPPVYFLTEETVITANKYLEYLRLAPYDKLQRREIVFIDNSTQKQYKVLYTQDGNTISVEMQTQTIESEYFLPQWLHDLCYQQDGELLKNYEALQKYRAQKQEAAIAERKAAVQERKVEQAKKKAEQRAAKKATEKAKKKATAKTTKTKTTKTKTTKPAASKPKKEETITEMWKNWAKDR